MKTTVLAAIALGALTALALAPADRAVAAEPFELDAAQMDRVTAGGILIIVHPPAPGFPAGTQEVYADTALKPSKILIELQRVHPPEPGIGAIPPSPGIEIHPPAPGFNG